MGDEFLQESLTAANEAEQTVGTINKLHNEITQLREASDVEQSTSKEEISSVQDIANRKLQEVQNESVLLLAKFVPPLCDAANPHALLRRSRTSLPASLTFQVSS
mgnify:CR=1 FL=1